MCGWGWRRGFARDPFVEVRLLLTFGVGRGVHRRAAVPPLPLLRRRSVRTPVDPAVLAGVVGSAQVAHGEPLDGLLAPSAEVRYVRTQRPTFSKAVDGACAAGRLLARDEVQGKRGGLAALQEWCELGGLVGVSW